MFTFTAVPALWALLTSICAASPVPNPKVEVTSIKQVFEKRSESGPKIGGANFPDPAIINVSNAWYAFATRTIGSSIHIQVAKSTDFSSWALVYNSDGTQYDALPNLPAWVDSSSPNTWAPDIVQLDDGTFVMYFSATTTSDTAKHCVGAATSSNVEGPYTATSDTALICPLSQGGAIDAAGYNDNESRYIVYKVDGNSIGHGGACGNDVSPYVATPLILQPVASDGVTLQGTATTLLNNDGASDQGIVEAPSLVKSGSTYILFFSSGCYMTGNYNVDYATASSITGTYTRASSPLFETGVDGLTAPGGADIWTDAKHLVFHANYGSGRAMYQAIVSVSGTTASA
ncbi:Arabinanase/levansucrase/invertase [Teratosphaeria nubilosa]|uniref:Arabinanase/levansucrase/invertase n=1 Tax=Teratosphaeria nubilosa TaxID=161662 RepID=A0A6G1KUT9_9PEZI|nr:Arabinanase/levansucrase/invertase [Teratosphaeria nubilosa]